MLVTGGAGFIGSAVARACVAADCKTLVVDDLSAGCLDRAPAQADLAVIDVRSDAFVRRAAAFRPDLIVHAAAQTSVPRSVLQPDLDHSINVGGTLRVVEVARAVGARVVFLSSGGAIYGETRGASEDDTPRPVSPYGRHKLEAERVLAGGGVPYAALRLANVYGPQQSADTLDAVIPNLARQLGAGEPVTIQGDGLQTRDFVHVDDVVRAVLLLGGVDVSGIWNVGTGVATSILQLLGMLERVIGPAVAVRHLPARQGDVRHSCLNVAKIRRLGWSPTVRLQEGLATVALAYAGPPGDR